eukprot:8409473-Pyramimonas_sp.AAC.1
MEFQEHPPWLRDAAVQVASTLGFKDPGPSEGGKHGWIEGGNEERREGGREGFERMERETNRSRE